jgi:hypothetical protein
MELNNTYRHKIQKSATYENGTRGYISSISWVTHTNANELAKHDSIPFEAGLAIW